MNTTRTIKKNEIEQKWYVIDAEGVRLGNLATKVASYLIGKHKVKQSDNFVDGDKVIVINSAKVDVYKKKLKQKKYYKSTGYIGGMKEVDLETLLETKPNKVIEKAVKGMLPNNKLRSQYLNNLYVYSDEEHSHQANKPETIKIKK